MLIDHSGTWIYSRLQYRSLIKCHTAVNYERVHTAHGDQKRKTIKKKPPIDVF